MFGIGSTELLVILVVALIVLGPKSLPKIAQTLGRAMGEFRKVSTDFQRALNTEIAFEDEAEKKRDEAKKAADAAKAEAEAKAAATPSPSAVDAAPAAAVSAPVAPTPTPVVTPVTPQEPPKTSAPKIQMSGAPVIRVGAASHAAAQTPAKTPDKASGNASEDKA